MSTYEEESEKVWLELNDYLNLVHLLSRIEGASIVLSHTDKVKGVIKIFDWARASLELVRLKDGKAEDD